MARSAASDESRAAAAAAVGSGWDDGCDGDISRSPEASLGAITEASNLTRLEESLEEAVELRLDDRSKNTGRKVSVSCKTWSWLSFELFSWEFIGRNDQGIDRQQLGGGDDGTTTGRNGGDS